MVPAWAQMVLHMPSAAESPTLQKRALSLAVGESLRLESLNLDDSSDKTATAELRRIAVVDAQTRFIVRTGDKTRDIDPPVRAHFSGKLAGESDSSVFVSIDGEGVMRSIIDSGGEMFVNEVRPASAKRSALALSRRIDQQSDFAEHTFSCGVTPQFVRESHPLADTALRQAFSSAAREAAPPHVAASGVQRRADLIIETDYELFQRFGSSNRMVGYIVDLFGYVNTRYQDEVGTRLHLSRIYLHETPADPWTQTTTSGQLDELRDYWNNTNYQASVPRHHVHLLSAKKSGGGIAYMGVLNNKSYSYGVSGNIEGDFSAENPQIVWDAKVVSHEIGHTFGSDHTHNFDNPYLGSNDGGAIDCCSADSNNSQCGKINQGAGRKGSLPGINSIAGGVPGQRNGSIMSYCHTMQPGLANISLNFGTNHPYGINPWRVADVMSTSAQRYLPPDEEAPLVQHTLSVVRSGNGAGSVSSSPSGIQCGSDCSEAYPAGTSVALIATPAMGSSFSGWSGACLGSGNTCNVSMDGARNVGAVFTQAVTSRIVTVSKNGSGGGRISSSPAGLDCSVVGCTTTSASFPSNTSITLTATPAAGSTFGGWGGACAGSLSTCTLAAGTSTLSISAVFNTTTPPLSYTLSVVPSGTGSGSVISAPNGIQCGSDCSELYAAGTTVVLTATPAADSIFAGWTGVCNNMSSTCKVTMDSVRSVGAMFAQKSTSRWVRVSKIGDGHGGIDSNPAGLNCPAKVCFINSAIFPRTTAVTLTATPAAGSTFSGWSGDCLGSHKTCVLPTGASFLDVTAVFNINSDGDGPLSDPMLFVNQQYYDLFNRSPDATSLNYWVSQIKAGAISRAELIEFFMAQPDFNQRYSPLVRLYTAYFQRMPDYGGLMYWHGQMYPANAGNGLLTNYVSEAFAQSPEFDATYGRLNNLQFVELVYQNVLGRAAEPAGRDYWVSRLNAGLIRGEMMVGFSESPENISAKKNSNSIVMAFAGMLRRMPGSYEYDIDLAVMNSGEGNLLMLIEMLLDSSEYSNRFK